MRYCYRWLAGPYLLLALAQTFGCGEDVPQVKTVILPDPTDANTVHPADANAAVSRRRAPQHGANMSPAAAPGQAVR